MSANLETRRDRLAAVGLAIGGAFGMAGSFVASAHLRHVFWTIDGVALVAAAALLAVKFHRRGDDGLAASFLVFLAGETLVLSTAATSLEAGRGPFAAGMALWAASLLMTSTTATPFPRWSRRTGLVAAALFAVSAGMIATGASLDATSAPLPSAGYPFLVLTMVGWIRSLLAPGGADAPREAPAAVGPGRQPLGGAPDLDFGDLGERPRVQRVAALAR